MQAAGGVSGIVSERKSFLTNVTLAPLDWPLLFPHLKSVLLVLQGAISVDSLAELEDGALLLRTLQLSKSSFPIGQRLLGSQRKMSLNPIAKQIPQIVEVCCSFIEKHGKGGST